MSQETKLPKKPKIFEPTGRISITKLKQLKGIDIQTAESKWAIKVLLIGFFITAITIILFPSKKIKKQHVAVDEIKKTPVTNMVTNTPQAMPQTQPVPTQVVPQQPINPNPNVNPTAAIPVQSQPIEDEFKEFEGNRAPSSVTIVPHGYNETMMGERANNPEAPLPPEDIEIYVD